MFSQLLNRLLLALTAVRPASVLCLAAIHVDHKPE
jgi:hypothetical protein